MRAQDCAGFYINAYKIPNAVNMSFIQNAFLEILVYSNTVLTLNVMPKSQHRSNCQKKSTLKYGLRVSGKKLTAAI